MQDMQNIEKDKWLDDVIRRFEDLKIQICSRWVGPSLQHEIGDTTHVYK
jgi:hypothetical protein